MTNPTTDPITIPMIAPALSLLQSEEKTTELEQVVPLVTHVLVEEHQSHAVDVQLEQS